MSIRNADPDGPAYILIKDTPTEWLEIKRVIILINIWLPTMEDSLSSVLMQKLKEHFLLTLPFLATIGK